MVDEIIKQVRPRMEKEVERFASEIKTIRMGRAETSMFEEIKVLYYGTSIPLKQLASIQAPSPTLIVITPFDKNALGDIELAIRNQNPSFSPANDGNQIRITLPPPSEERRRELTKFVHEKGEQTKIAIRNIRHEAWERIQKAERAKQISEDDRYRGEEMLNRLIDELNKKIDEIVKEKNKEIMEF